MKRELRWDPAIDIIGHRLPTAFVHRGTHDHARQIALVEHLLDDLGPGDAVVIFPEGTRYSPAKRARVIASLAGKDPEAHARALRLRHVLPPHPGGPLGLLEHNPGADVVLVAHTGLEGANHLRDLSSGALLGAEVRVKLWRVPAAEIPREREASLRWLQAAWEQIDAWLEAQGHDRSAPADVERAAPPGGTNTP
jgi:1-acyl-sn-glycerol-3-phosphate acyltransferase